MNISTLGRAAWVEVDLDVFDQNVKAIKAKVAPTEMLGVIKADAYGHGAIQMAAVLQKNGINTFAVATIEEGIELRRAGYIFENIIVLGLTADELVDAALEYELWPVVDSIHTARLYSEKAEKYGRSVKVLIAVDTGMGRIGYRVDDDGAAAEVAEMSKLPNIEVYGLFSHFALADAADKTYANFQLENYKKFDNMLKDAGVNIAIRTLSNSAAISDIEDAYYDLVRPGIILYGYYPSDEVMKDKVEVHPVMSVKARVLHLKTVPVGTCVSYGCKFVAERESVIATIGLGYADGFPRLYSEEGKVIVNGVKVPIAGRINMDQCMIDVTDAGDVKLGDEVVIIGRQGDCEITADDIAKATGTISYEVTCGLGQRLPKQFKLTR
ncbi:MAG: alanine racemase [Firmicutes bacterium]|nr:alanine racemase [Bacillota bacterium]